MYIYSVRVYYSVHLQCTGISRCIGILQSDWIVCLIKCTLLYYYFFFGNVIVDISQYRLSVGNYGQSVISNWCSPLLSSKTRYECVHSASSNFAVNWLTLQATKLESLTLWWFWSNFCPCLYTNTCNYISYNIENYRKT